MSSKNITLFEFQRLTTNQFRMEVQKCLNREVDFNYIDKIKEEIKKINVKLNLKVIKLYFDYIQATQYVGFIRLKEFSIQIIPKIYKDNEVLPNLEYLIFLLKYLKLSGISLKKLDLGLLGKSKGDLFSFLIEMFLIELKKQIIAGLYRSYMVLKDSSQFIKGKLLVNQQIKYNIVKPWLFFCQFEEFMENNPINQIFKYALFLLKNSIQSTNIKKLIDEILILFINVDFIKIEPFHFERIHFTRLNIFYKHLIGFCKLIITQSNINFNKRTIESFYFLFDMNRLFEKFISIFMKRNQNEIKVNNSLKIVDIDDQVVIVSLFDFFNLKPDLIITYLENGKLNKLLLDFKYKILKTEKNKDGISQSDFYQMFAYSQSQFEKFNEIILLYPRASKLDFKEFKHKYDITRKSIKLLIRFIDIEKVYNFKSSFFEKDNLIRELNQILNIN